MADVVFNIGHKEYTLACQPGEEKLLEKAARLLDAEAQAIIAQAGRMPEPRLLLVSGLMLADRLHTLEDRALSVERELNRLKANPQRTEVPVVPQQVADTLAELAARAEALADKAEEALQGQ